MLSCKQEAPRVEQHLRSVRTAVLDELLEDNAFDEQNDNNKMKGFAWVRNQG